MACCTSIASSWPVIDLQARDLKTARNSYLKPDLCNCKCLQLKCLNCILTQFNSEEQTNYKL